MSLVRRRRRRIENNPSTDLETRQLALMLLVDMAGWKSLSGYPKNLTADGEMLRLVDLGEYEDEDVTARAFIDLLREQQRAFGDFIGFPKRLTQSLFRLAEELGLAEVEMDILGLVTLISTSDTLANLIDDIFGEMTTDRMELLLAQVLGAEQDAVRQALSGQGLLNRTGLLRVDRSSKQFFLSKLDVLDGLCDGLSSGEEHVDELLMQFYHPADSGQLNLTDFGYVEREVRLAKRLLDHVVRQGTRGTNILIYGPPGVGKTELSKALARALGLDLFVIPTEDNDGDPVKGDKRLRCLRMAQSVLDRRGDTLLLFDEVEDVFNRGFDDVHAKGWINRQLEQNPVPTLWLCNSIDSMDTAFIRRYDLVLHLDIPPKAVRRDLIDAQLKGLKVSDTCINRLVQHESLPQGVLDRAARVVRLSGRRSVRETEKDLEMALENTLEAMGYAELPKSPASAVMTYDPAYLNADQDMGELARGLTKDPRGRFCLYGPPGTGKTAFGHHLAEVLDKPLIIRRASDLLDKFVGETEKAIAQMFREAEADDAILLLDEADSFLRDRTGAHASWEVTQVNELLTRMEAFDGIFIASTNLRDNLDAASMRRFDLKIHF
ncbi:MAG: AAA family ATPase, partial [Gammaproteobacteria bacterium SHHR-1]